MRKLLRKLICTIFGLAAIVTVFNYSYIKTVEATVTLNTWNSDTFEVGYWSYSTSSSAPTVYINNLNSTFNCIPYFNTAVNAWNSNGIYGLITTVPTNPKILAYGGTRAELNSIGCFTYTSSVYGNTKFYQYSQNGYVNYQNASMGINVNIPVFSFEKIYTSECQEIGSSYYVNTALHEYGHALGWIGHNINLNTVMNQDASTLTALQSTDINHLVNIYDIMN